MSKKPVQLHRFLKLFLKHMFDYDKMSAMKIKKADWIIFIVSVTAFTAAMLIMHFCFHDGDYAVVYVDGKEIASYPLDQDITQTIDGYDGGENILVIKKHQAKIVSADCPDKSCTHQKSISANGESIVCLPHRVMIMICSKQESEVDAVAQ